jgi:myo-inositol-1(or 4)-monophosphatase
MSDAELRAFLALAKRAAAAGAAVVMAAEDGRTVVADIGRDIKISADRLAEADVVGLLRSESELPVLTEESGFLPGHEHGGYRWIVDPLDGSFNYARAIPFYAVSVALWQDESPVLGVVHDVTRSEVFSGIVGIGAWLNDERLNTSTVDNAIGAVLCTGFPVSTDFSAAAVRAFIEQVGQFKKIRLLGSAALSLAYVASGRADAYLERDIKLWDVAGGLAIVQAAGGHISIERNGAALTCIAKADNGHLSLCE